MDNSTKQNDIELLKRAVEEAVDMVPLHDRHFHALRRIIFQRTGQYISSTTLKRLWGYLNEPFNPRETTLSILAKAVGYDNWNSFQNRNMEDRSESKISSSPKLSEYVNVLEDLNIDDRVLLFWYPGRECVVRYLGDMQFEVEEVKNTNLQPGDRFTTHLIMSGHPLYLSNLKREGMKPMAYICGKLLGGIQYKLLKKENK